MRDSHGESSDDEESETEAGADKKGEGITPGAVYSMIEAPSRKLAP